MKKISRQQAYQRRQVAKGLCAKCARPRVTATFCKIHRAYANAKCREYSAKRRQQTT